MTEFRARNLQPLIDQLRLDAVEARARGEFVQAATLLNAAECLSAAGRYRDAVEAALV